MVLIHSGSSRKRGSIALKIAEVVKVAAVEKIALESPSSILSVNKKRYIVPTLVGSKRRSGRKASK